MSDWPVSSSIKETQGTPGEGQREVKGSAWAAAGGWEGPSFQLDWGFDWPVGSLKQVEILHGGLEDE